MYMYMYMAGHVMVVDKMEPLPQQKENFQNYLSDMGSTSWDHS